MASQYVAGRRGCARCAGLLRNGSAPTPPLEAAIVTVVLRRHARRAPTTVRRPDPLAFEFGSRRAVRADPDRAAAL